MPRLPIPGGDQGSWGQILNDYLAQAHNGDGTIKAGAVNGESIVDGSVTQAKLSSTGATNGQVLSSDGVNLVWSTPGAGAGDATAISKGVIQLAGDLAGTAATPTVPGLAGKEAIVAAGTTSQYYRGDKSWQTLDKAAVGLANVDNTSDANKPVSATTQTALDNKVSKGQIVFNVRDYGAVGDWSSGTAGTDDLAAINAALSAAAAAVGTGVSAARVLVPWTTGNGYKFSDTIATPVGVEWDMRAPLVYTGPAGRSALVIGGATAQFRRHHVVQLMRYALTDWLSEADAGLVIRNHYASTFTIDRCDQFTVGVTCIGDAANGFSYNKLYIGQLIDNKIALDLTNDTGGWCNENQTYGGRFTVSSSTYTTLDRVGIRLTSRATPKYYNNANTFYSPSFELKGAAIVGDSTCMLVEYGTTNEITRARHESNSPTVAVQQNNSANNWIDFQYSDEGSLAPVFSVAGNSASGGVTRKYTSMIDRSLRVIYKADQLHLKACYYDGATSVNLPGLTVGTSATGNTDARAASSIIMAVDYVEIPSSRYAGFYMSTRILKQFAVFRDAEVGYGGRFIIRTYDSSGAILSTAGAIQTTSPVNNPVYGTPYGGAWRLGVDSNAPFSFGVSSEVDYVFIGIAGGTNPARVRALSVGTLEPTNPAVWLASLDNNQNYGTAAPTAGTWAVGREVINAAPDSTSPLSWVCVAAGTPGTWRPTGNSGGAVSPQIDVITSTGTWTKPAGAKTIRTILIAGGNGGASGRRGAAGTVRCGGGGGGGGGVTIADLDAADVPSSLTVTIGAGGVGGAAVTTDDTNGNAGSLGGVTLFGGLASAYVGSTAAAGGTTNSGVGGTAGTGLSLGGAGGTASATGGVGGNGVTGSGGGGGGGSGGGITSGNIAANGGIGLASRMTAGSNASGGVVDSTVPQSGTAPSAKGMPGQGGGGGAASITTAAQAGATPTGYGGGGGGGGASLNGNNSGAGGTGAPGYAMIITAF